MAGPMHRASSGGQTGCTGARGSRDYGQVEAREDVPQGRQDLLAQQVQG